MAASTVAPTSAQTIMDWQDADDDDDDYRLPSSLSQSVTSTPVACSTTVDDSSYSSSQLVNTQDNYGELCFRLAAQTCSQ